MKFKMVEIGSICEIFSGATPKTSNDEFWNGDIHWTTPKDLSDLDKKYLSDTPRKITDKGLKSCSAAILPERSVLLSSRAPIGLVAINTIPVCTNQGFKSLVPKNEMVDAEFLYWWLTANKKKLQESGRGATFKEISKAIVSSFKIPLPPLEEQKRIAKILDAADALRAKRRQAVAQLDTFLQSTFLDLFGDPVTNPKGWDEEPVGNVSIIQGGLQLSSKRKSLDMKKPYLRVANVYRGYLDLSEIKNIGLSPNELQRTTLKKGDVLIVEGHGNSNEIGRCAVWNGDIEECVHQNHLIRVRTNAAQIHPTYLSFFLNSEGGSIRLKGQARTTSGLNTLSTKKVSSTKIHIPPFELQQRFTSIVDSVEQQKSKMQAHLAQLDTLFASLQQRAFKGEL